MSEHLDKKILSVRRRQDYQLCSWKVACHLQINVTTGICAWLLFGSPSPLDMVCGSGISHEQFSAIPLHLINSFSKSVDSEPHDKTSLWKYWDVTGCIWHASLVVCPSIWAPADIQKSPVHFLQDAESVWWFSSRRGFIFPPAGSAGVGCWLCPGSCLLRPGSLKGDSSHISINCIKWGIRVANKKGIIIALIVIFTISLIIFTVSG